MFPRNCGQINVVDDRYGNIIGQHPLQLAWRQSQYFKEAIMLNE